MKQKPVPVFHEQITYEEGDGKGGTLYTAVVRATSLKRDVRVVIVDCMEPGKKTQTRKVFFSTDINMSAKDIMESTGQGPKLSSS